MALDIFGEFGFNGGQDVAPDPLQSPQICINFYPEVDAQGSKEIVALLGCPGLIQLVAAPGGGAPGFSNTMTQWPQPSSVKNLPVRGLWELPDDTQALAVIGNTLYLVTVTVPANAKSFPTLALTSVGTLATHSGPVAIRDNNAGGYAVIVDGPNGYLYNLAGQSVTPTAVMSVTSGSNIATFTASPNYQLIPGITVTDSLHYLPSGTTITAVDYSSDTLTLSQNATGTSTSDTFTGTVPAFMQIQDPAFLGSNTVAFVDGWWIFQKPGSQIFYTNYPQYSISFNGSYYALKDAYPDNLIAVMENKEELWLFGDKTTEIWYDAGGQYFPFARLVGTPIQVGCRAPHSVARFTAGGQDSLICLGRNERGENIVVKTNGFALDTVSPPSFGDEVATYPITDDAIGFTYQEDTHEFYLLHFPTADVTWCYDSQTGLMHKRLSYDPYAQLFHRHRSMSFMNFQGMRIVGDYENGALYWLTRTSYTDAGWPLLAKRRAPHVWDQGARTRVFLQSLQLDFVPGVGNASGMGSNPQVGLAISRDSGRTFGTRTYAPLGTIGQTWTRTMWRRLGMGRDIVFDIEVIDPVRRDLIGCTLRAVSEPDLKPARTIL